MADIGVVNSVFEGMTAEQLVVPSDNAGVTLGSNLIPLTTEIVTWILNRLKDGYTPKQIKNYIKANHPSGKGISWGQMRMILERRRAYYAATQTTEEP